MYESCLPSCHQRTRLIISLLISSLFTAGFPSVTHALEFQPQVPFRELHSQPAFGLTGLPPSHEKAQLFSDQLRFYTLSFIEEKRLIFSNVVFLPAASFLSISENNNLGEAVISGPSIF